MQGAKTTDQNSACFNQDNMTIAISVKMTTAIFEQNLIVKFMNTMPVLSFLTVSSATLRLLFRVSA
jgi:hypothetical protein